MKSKSSKTKGIRRSPVLPDSCVDDRSVHPVLKSYLGYAMYKAALRLRGMMNDALEEYGLIVTQIGMLKLIRELGPISQIELGKQMGIDKASMVKFIDGLEGLKLVIRSVQKDDRRVKLLQITRDGEKLLEKVLETRSRIEEKFLEPLTAAERKALIGAISKLLV